MEILYICGYAAEYKGNFIESLTKLDKSIDGKINGCYIFPQEAKNRKWIQELEREGAHIFYNTNSYLGEFKLQRRICKEYEIDIVYHHFWNLKDCFANRLLKVIYPKIKMVIHHHNEYHVSSSIFNEKIKHFILNADMHIGCGEYVTEEINNSKYKNVICVNNGIDFKRLDNYEDIDKTKGLNLLTFSSYSYDVKGIDISIKSCFEARKQGIPVNLIIAIAANWNEIEKRVLKDCDGSIPSWVRLLPSRSDVATYYHFVDAYLNSSRSEGLCYSSVEAIYCGAQVLQSNTKGNRLDIPYTYISKVGDVEQLTNNIIKFYNEKNHDSKNRKKQRDYIIENYSIEKWADEEIKALNKLMVI